MLQFVQSLIFNKNIMENKVQQVKDQKGKATASLVLGIIGMFAWFIPIIGLPIQVIGLVLGIKGWKSSKHWLAVVGVILCIIGLVLTIINASIGAYMGATGQHPLVNEIME
jgi:hypothetical protein